ncbi:MAG: YdcF family protein [Anaerolineaceae bacterium]|nr:YdcF family protein [Anaerolineaceae bacterium]
MENQQSPKSSGCLGPVADFVGKSLAVVLGLVIIVLSMQIIFWMMGGLLIVQDPLEPADAIVALSGGNDRIDEAARLYQEKYGRTVILTETGEFLPEWNVNYSSLLIAEAVRLGIPAGAITVTEGAATSTMDEANHVRDLMANRGLKSCIVVTDPFHTLRTRLIFREVFADSGMSVAIKPVTGHWYKSRSWWLTSEGRSATFLEYVKLFGYFLGIKGG